MQRSYATNWYTPSSRGRSRVKSRYIKLSYGYNRITKEGKLWIKSTEQDKDMLLTLSQSDMRRLRDALNSYNLSED